MRVRVAHRRARREYRRVVIAFAAALATSPLATEAASEAAARARVQLGEAAPVLAIVFASVSYGNLDAVPGAISKELGPLPVIGGTAGGAVFAGVDVANHGVLVALLGGEGVRTTTVTAPISSPELFDVLPAGAVLLRAADHAARDGFEEPLCLAFAPAARVDGEAFVAVLRKGTGARMQLAGALTGDDFTFDRSRVFAEGAARADRVVMAGIFTRRPVGVAARHGWRPAGPIRVVTSGDRSWLVRIDGRRALDAWVADVRAAGARPPPGGADLLLFLANAWSLGIEASSHASTSPLPVETAVRAPIALRDDGAVLLSSAIAEGTRVHVMNASAGETRDAGIFAARIAHERAGGSSAGGLVLTCSGRLAGLGDRFREEQASIGRALGAPTAGAGVFGEIGRAHREVDGFHNLTNLVVAWPR